MKKSKYKNTCEDYSISKVLRDQKRSNEYFELMLNNITLEELIALKLELGYKAIGFVLHGFPIWRGTNYIVKDALLKYAVSATKSKREAMRLLGLPSKRFFKYLKKFNINAYFKPNLTGEQMNVNNRSSVEEDLSKNSSR